MTYRVIVQTAGTPLINFTHSMGTSTSILYCSGSAKLGTGRMNTNMEPFAVPTLCHVWRKLEQQKIFERLEATKETTEQQGHRVIWTGWNA